MRKLIKSIREYLGLSQTEFADKIGVTFATVNRWENGRAIPTKLAQTTLYEYCKEHGVPVYQMILEKIKAEYPDFAYTIHDAETNDYYN